MEAGSSGERASARSSTRERRYGDASLSVNRRSTGLSTNPEDAADALFLRYAYPDWLRQHSLLVGRIATLLAERSASELDMRSVALAAYLHDVGRSALLAGDVRDHGALSALILAAEGLAECAEPARRHPVYAVLDPATAPRTLAERIVHYADRRGGMTVLPLDERISETAQRHPRYAESIERSRPLARAMERELCERLRFKPEDLAREVAERWP